MTARKRNASSIDRMSFETPSGLTNRRGVPYERIDVAVLDVMRRIFVGHAAEQTDGLATAAAVSEWHFGPQFGKTWVVALNAYIDALRRNRRSPFRFSNPSCACCQRRVTKAESQLLFVIHAVRRGDFADALSEAIDVCEDLHDDDFLEEAGRLALLFEETPVRVERRSLH